MICPHPRHGPFLWALDFDFEFPEDDDVTPVVDDDDDEDEDVEDVADGGGDAIIIRRLFLLLVLSFSSDKILGAGNLDGGRKLLLMILSGVVGDEVWDWPENNEEFLDVVEDDRDTEGCCFWDNDDDDSDDDDKDICFGCWFIVVVPLS